MAHERHGAAFVLGAVVGGVAGAVVTLLRAPQAGTETRARLAEQAGALSEQANQTLSRLAGAAEERASQVPNPFAALRAPEDEASPTVATVAGATEAPDMGTLLLLPDPLEPDPIVTQETEQIDVGGWTPAGNGRPAGSA